MSASKVPFISEREKKAKLKSRTHTQRFEFLMRLIRISQMLKNAKIVHTTY